MNCNHTSSELSGHQLCIYNDGITEGQELERERIIKLLESQHRSVFQDSYTDENYADTAIALIKGEQK